MRASALIVLGVAGCGALPSPGPSRARPSLAAPLLSLEGPRSLASASSLHVPGTSSSAAGNPLRIRGGGAAAAWGPDKIFNAYFGGLAVGIAGVRMAASSGSKKKEDKLKEKDSGFPSLQARFLAVFWLFKLADWLHGPYFYEVYASKIFGGKPMSQELIGRMFLCGFASSMFFGTFAGSLVDKVGRKAGCIAFAVMYTLSALSTRSDSLPVLVAGRVLGGTATSLLFSAPEAWLVGEHEAKGYSGDLLGGAFGWAYFGDGIMAILAGKIAGLVAGRKGGKGAWLSGPSSPFELSCVFLAIGAALVGSTWGENYGSSGAKGQAGAEAAGGGLVASMGEAGKVMWQDKKILLTGAVQSLFEGAMYIFVLQWPPAFKMLSGEGQNVPFGSIFACLMSSCMLGSSVFGLLLKWGLSLETFVAGMLAVSSVSLGGAAWALSARPKGAFHVAAVCFFLFEACVGLYFPSIGTLRSKYVPNSHKSAIMNLFRVPLNLIVITTFLQIQRLGVVGALACSSVVLSLALLSQLSLRAKVSADEAEAAASRAKQKLQAPA